MSDTIEIQKAAIVLKFSTNYSFVTPQKEAPAQVSRQSTPFSRAYWKTACLELKNTRQLVLAALLIALRVAVKSVSIPVGENLYIAIGFLPNALGSLIYGPVMALLSAAVTDVLGNLLFPKGPFFAPFMLVEMLASLLFALFLYKAPLRIWRAAFSKLFVNLFCNLWLTPIFLSWMSGKAAVLASMPRIVKNILLFPLETFLLVIFLNSLLPVMRRSNIIASGQTALTLSARHIILLAGLFIVSIAAVLLYYWRFAS